MKPQLDDLTSQTSETTFAPASDYVESKDKFCPNLKLLNKIYALMSVVKNAEDNWALSSVHCPCSTST